MNNRFFMFDDPRIAQFFNNKNKTNLPRPNESGGLTPPKKKNPLSFFLRFGNRQSLSVPTMDFGQWNRPI